MLKQFILMMLLAGIVYGQIPTPIPAPGPTPDRNAPVTTTQGFIDDAAKAFALVESQREAIQKFLNERAKTEAERSGAEALLKGMNDFLALKDRFIGQYELMVNRLIGIIDFQYKIIGQLQAMLNKPKSFFQKLLKGVVKVLEAAVFILVGKGIGSVFLLNDHRYIDLGDSRPSTDPFLRRGPSILFAGNG